MYGPKIKRTKHPLRIINKRTRTHKKVQTYAQNLHKLLNQDQGEDAPDQTPQQSSTLPASSESSENCVVCAAPARYGEMRCEDCAISGDIQIPRHVCDQEDCDKRSKNASILKRHRADIHDIDAAWHALEVVSTKTSDEIGVLS